MRYLLKECIMNRREESTGLRSPSHLYKTPARKPTQKGPSELAPTGFAFPRNLGGRSFTWTKGKDSDLGAKMAALPPPKQKYVMGHLQEKMAGNAKKFGLNDPKTQEWKEYLAIARKSSKRSSNKKKRDKNKGMRKKRSREGRP